MESSGDGPRSRFRDRDPRPRPTTFPYKRRQAADHGLTVGEGQRDREALPRSRAPGGVARA